MFWRAGAFLLQLERERGLRWAIGAAAAYAALAATCDAYVLLGQLLAAHILVLTLTGAGSLKTLHRTYSVVYSLGACSCERACEPPESTPRKPSLATDAWEDAINYIMSSALGRETRALSD